MKRITTCPYCKAKISYLDMWLNHNHSSFKCNKCEYISEILFSKQIRKNAALSILLSLIIFAIFIIIGNMRLWEIIIVLLPFAYFYYNLPFGMFLISKPQPVENNEKQQKPQKNKRQNDVIYKSKRNVSDQTAVIPDINYYEKKYIPFDKPKYDISQTQKIDDLDLY